MDLEKALVEFNEKFCVPKEFEIDPRYPYPAYRANFMLEELHEYIKAYLNGNRENMLDALVDIVYVAIGTSVSQGFAFNEAFKRVHEANMKKLRQATERSPYDIVKPEGWTPPNLKDLT